VRARALAAGAVLALALAGCGGDPAPAGGAAPAGDEPRLVEVPHPDLGAVGAELRLQIEALRSEVATATPGADPESLGQAWGDLARAYHAYGFADAAAAAYQNAQSLQPDLAAWWYGQALLERQRGRHAVAVELFRRVLERDPDSAAARLHLGEALLDLGEIDAATGPLQEAAGSPAHAACALAALGRAARDRGDAARSLELYQRALEAQPGADLLHHSIAAAHRNLGDEAQARAALERAGANPPSFPDPVAESLEELRTTSGALLLRGSRALASERPREAVEHYRRAVAADPEDAEARRTLALALRATGDLDGALAELEQAARLDPESHVVAFDLGNLQLARGAHQAAADAFTRSLALRADSVPARFNLANAQLLLGRAEDALANLERVLELDPDHQRARYQAAMAKSRLDRAEEAMRDLEAMLVATPGYAPSLLGLAELRRQGGDLAGARAAYEEVEQRGGDVSSRVDARIGLATIAVQEGRVDAAIDHLRAAVTLAPERDDVREELARALEGSGRYLEAAAERRALVELRPDAPMARLLEATALVSGGRSDLARQRLEEAVERMPDDRMLANSLARLLSTAREAEVRDGHRALAIVRRLQSTQSGPDLAETLAMAHAEVGEFAEAITLQKALIEQVRAAGQTGHLPRLEENLRRYERREPVRM
jgi:tetratricopeptide (TPR) repeat protein